MLAHRCKGPGSYRASPGTSNRNLPLLSDLRRFLLAGFVALRLVRSRRSRRLSTVTIVSMAGVAFGVMALTVVLGVTGGFQDAFRERILGLYPHLVVIKRAGDFREYPELLSEMEATPGVVAASPATYDDMMIAHGVHRSGTVVKGVDLASVDRVVRVRDLVVDGGLDGLSEVPELEETPGAVAVRSATAGAWLTIVATTGGAVALAEDRTPPDPGNARVSVLDLRGAARPLSILLEPAAAQVGPPAEGPPADESPAEGHPADGAHLPDGPVPLGPTRPGGLTAAREVSAGTWTVDATGETLALEEGTIATLVLLPAGAGGGPPPTRLLVEPARVPLPERTAMVRMVHARPGAPPLRLAGPGGERVSPDLAWGEFSTFSPVRARLPGIVLGKELAKRLHAEVGSEVTLVTPLRGVDNKMLGPYGMAPSSAQHEVSGIFESGFYEYDVRLALVELAAAQRFLNRGPVIRWIEVRAADLLRVSDARRRLQALVDPYDLPTLVDQAAGFRRRLERFVSGDVRGSEQQDPTTFVGGLRNVVQLVNLVKYQEVDLGWRPRFRLIDWKEMNTNLFSALKLQKVVLTIFFLIIILVGSFVVVGSQIMVIHEKTPDIAILKAMGATSGAIRAVFTLQGLLVAGVGTALGLAAGVGICALVAWVDYRLDASVYLIDRLPIELAPLDLVLVAVLTAACILVATQYSAARAAAKTPVEGLRAVD